MTYLASIRLRREVEGLSVCESPCGQGKFSKEYHLGAQTGDLGCSVCGGAFFAPEVEAFRRNQAK